MKKSNKIIIGIVIAVLVVSVAVLVGQSELFQGKLKLFGNFPRAQYLKWFLYRTKIVSVVTSPVTSPVPSIVVSDVTSPGGTSRVASVITSPVASPVASAVAADDETAARTDTKKLKSLTEEMLKSIAKQDYKKNPDLFIQKAQEYYRNNPGKFTLSEQEKQRIIELYKQKNPSEFIFRPAK